MRREAQNLNEELGHASGADNRHVQILHFHACLSKVNSISQSQPRQPKSTTRDRVNAGSQHDDRAWDSDRGWPLSSVSTRGPSNPQSKVIFGRFRQLLGINAHKMAPTTTRRLQERGRDTPSKGLLWHPRIWGQRNTRTGVTHLQENASP